MYFEEIWYTSLGVGETMDLGIATSFAIRAQRNAHCGTMLYKVLENASGYEISPALLDFEDPRLPAHRGCGFSEGIPFLRMKDIFKSRDHWQITFDTDWNGTLKLMRTFWNTQTRVKQPVLDKLHNCSKLCAGFSNCLV